MATPVSIGVRVAARNTTNCQKEETELYLDTQELSRTDRVANDTIRAQAQQLVAMTDEIEHLKAAISKTKALTAKVERLKTVIEEMGNSHGDA